MDYSYSTGIRLELEVKWQVTRIARMGTAIRKMMEEFLSRLFQDLRTMSKPVRTVRGAYINTSQVLIRGIDPRLIAVKIPRRHLPRIPRLSHRLYAKRSKKIRKIWLNREITWAWTSPQRNEKRGYSLIVLEIVLVLSQRISAPRFSLNYLEKKRRVRNNKHEEREPAVSIEDECPDGIH